MWLRINILYRLILINIAVFLFINLFVLFGFLFNNPDVSNTVLSLFSVPSNFGRLLFRFWTIFTYMFTHQDFWHLLGNMLWLYFLGSLLLNVIEQKDFLILYILGGLSGALFFIISFNVFPAFTVEKHFSILLGASGSVTAIVIAVATLIPNENIYLFGIVRIRLFIIAIFMLVYDFFLLKSSNAGGHFAHLGGALYGFIFALQLKKGNNIQNFAHNLWGSLFERNRKIKIVKNNLKSNNDYDFTMNKNQIRQEIDRLLDKISLHGYNSLNKKERDFLKKYSKFL